MKRRLLFIGDACVSTGFARATHYTCDVLRHAFDVHVLGMNYNGDPHTWPYPIYPCGPFAEFGLGRVKELIDRLGPAVIVVQQDPWNFQGYLRRTGNTPVVGLVAVDGKNCQGTQLSGLAHAIFWTKFGESEARAGGYTGSSTVIPLGVDLSIYQPADRADARTRMGLDRVLANRGLPPDTFMVGVVGRNQHRKRLDLVLNYFAEWVHTRKIADAALWLHVAPTGDAAFNLENLGAYYRISDRILIPDIPPICGYPEEMMARIYSIFDVLLTTTHGEGFGLPMFEAMACGVPIIAPDWSALGELLAGTALLVPCTSTAVAPQINTLGGVADHDACIAALDTMYRDHAVRAQCRASGLALVARPEYRWEHIGEAVTVAVERALAVQSIAVPIDRRVAVGV